MQHAKRQLSDHHSEVPHIIEHDISKHATPKKVSYNNELASISNPSLYNRPSVIVYAKRCQEKKTRISNLSPKCLFPNRISDVEVNNNENKTHETIDAACNNTAPQHTQNQRKKRRYDRYNFCIFCEKIVLKLRRHLMNNHKNEQVIAEYIALFESCPEESKDRRKRIMADLTLKGNYKYNKSLLNNSLSDKVPCSSYLPVKRPPKNKEYMPSDCITCTVCMGLIVKKTLLPARITMQEKI